MSPPIGTGGGPPGEGAALVADVERYVAEWRALLAQGARSGAAVEGLLRASPALQDRARRASFGGLAHHLARIDAIAAAPGGFASGALDAPLRDISEFLGQIRQSLGAPAQRLPSGPPLPSADAGSLQPPRMLTHMPGVAPRTGVQPVAPGHVDISLKVTPPPAPPMPAVPAAMPGGPPMLGLAPIGLDSPNAGARPMGQPLTGAGQLPAPAAPPGALPGLSPLPLDMPRDPAMTGPMAMPDLRGPPGAPPLAAPPLDLPNPGGHPPPQASPFNFRGAPAPQPVGPPPGLDMPAPGAGAGGLPPQSMRTGAPKLMVRTMFGLRAFGKQKEPAGAPPLVTGAQPAAAQQQPGSLLGLRSLSSEAGTGPQRSGAVLPKMLNNSLPPLPGAPREEAEAPPPSLFGDLIRRRGKPSTESQKMRARERDSGQRRARQAGTPPRRALRRQHDGTGSLLWAYIALGVLALGAIVTVTVLVWRRHQAPEPEAATSDKAVPSASAVASVTPRPESTAAMPRERLVTEDEGLRSMLSIIHGKGKESAELRALVDDQAALLHRMVTTQKCQGSTDACDKWNEAKDLLNSSVKRIEKRKVDPDARLRSRWMAGLTMPDIPIEDDPLVQRAFEAITVNPVGRERFVSMLFRCGSYWDLIRTTLQRYELPQALMAVVFTESGCTPTIDSPVGAKGLWQFMPETGRAYHLRIIENKLDERMSPVKSTEAAVHYLSDLKQKLNSWDLVFASYNLGPYGVLARVRKAGDDTVTFWDLADADYLPEETRNYVPYVQAYALVLANLRKLNFGAVQMKARENTADLEVPSGTRLSLVARVASTSLATVKAYNPDILSDLVPTVPSQRFAVQVPKDNVWQARDMLAALLAQKDDGDLCVPTTFDWGKQRFTDEMKLACDKRLASQPAAPVAPAATP